MTSTARCRSCKAPIIWAITSAGNLQPLDAQPRSDGNIRLTDEMRASLQGSAPLCFVLPATESLFPDDAPRYMPHHATCPDAESWHHDR